MIVNGLVHRFDEQLDYSNKLSDEGAWVQFYRQLWPNAMLIIRIDGKSEWQRHGVDREIVLPNGKRFYINEKKRKKDWGDLLLEEWSVYYGEGHSSNKVGWSLDGGKRCDFIAYAIPCVQTCYLLPFEILRQTFTVNRSDWLRRFRFIDVPNDGYVTRNVPVPWDTFKTELWRQMQQHFDATALELPQALTAGPQLEFSWG